MPSISFQNTKKILKILFMILMFFSQCLHRALIQIITCPSLLLNIFNYKMAFLMQQLINLLYAAINVVTVYSVVSTFLPVLESEGRIDVEFMRQSDDLEQKIIGRCIVVLSAMYFNATDVSLS